MHNTYYNYQQRTHKTHILRIKYTDTYLKIKCIKSYRSTYNSKLVKALSESLNDIRAQHKTQFRIKKRQQNPGIFVVPKHQTVCTNGWPTTSYLLSSAALINKRLLNEHLLPSSTSTVIYIMLLDNQTV